MSSDESYLSALEEELVEEFDTPQQEPPTHRVSRVPSSLSTTISPVPQVVSSSAQTEEPLYYDSPLVNPFDDQFRSIYPQQLAEPCRISVERGVCLRCGQAGHRRNRCPGAAILFCSGCGTVGIQSRHCSCRRHGREQDIVTKSTYCSRRSTRAAETTAQPSTSMSEGQYPRPSQSHRRPMSAGTGRNSAPKGRPTCRH